MTADLPEMAGERAVRVLALTINGQRHVFAAMVPAGKDPMEMTLGEWQAASALSAVALCNDFFDRPRPLSMGGGE